MGVKEARNRKKRRTRFFNEQDGKCWWCQCDMVHWDDYTNIPKYKHIVPQNGATIDHIRDRFDPTRRHIGIGRRWRIACYECNHRRGKESQAAQAIEELWKRSKSPPQNIDLTMFCETVDLIQQTCNSSDQSADHP